MYDPCGNGPSVTMNSGSLSLGFNCMLEAQVTVWNEVTGSGSAGVWTVKVVDMLGGGCFFFSSIGCHGDGMGCYCTVFFSTWQI